MTESFPLQWPFGKERTAYPKRSNFDVKFAVARDELLREIKLLGGTRSRYYGERNLRGRMVSRHVLFCGGIRYVAVGDHETMTNITRRPVFQKSYSQDKKRDLEYRIWIATQKCCIGGDCKGDVVAGHVRLGGVGGTGMKPLLSCVPLCDHHHHVQHNRGHTALKPTEWWLEEKRAWLRRWLQLVR